MTPIKHSWLRHPAFIAAGSAALMALVAANAVAFLRGLEAPWLLGTVIIADMLVIGSGIVVAAREVLMAEGRSEATQARLAALVEWSDDAIISLSLDGTVESWNRGAERLFGYDRSEAIGRDIGFIIPDERRPEEEAVLERVRQGQPVPPFETVRRAKDGRLIDISLSVSPVRDEAGRIAGASKVGRDVTAQKLAREDALSARSALTEAQARLGAIVDSAMDAVITVDEQQRIVLFNRAAEQVFGLRRDDALGSPLERLLPERFRAGHSAHIEKFGRTGVTSRKMGDVTTLWARRTDGTEFPIEASISQAVEGGRRFFTVILRDITLRKRADDELKASQQELRDLSARVLEAREEEKTRIARELHDELGQLLTALKMDLAWMRERLPAGEAAEKAQEMSAVLDQTVTSTRRISADLRPLMLDDLGLADAAHWLVDDFARRSGVSCEIRLHGDEALREIDGNIATVMYRALQESLTNIAKHSGARNAWISLAAEGARLHLEVEDDGRGIAAGDMAKTRSLGLKGMRERVAYFGGSIDVARAVRGGTRIRLEMPMRRADA
ncbi:MAG: PAS domain S-box protein [Clostridia bacterium]